MLKNVASNLGNYLYSVLSSLLLAPFILRQLGEARYGVWALVGEVLTYYGLLDFGIRTALNYFVGRALARRETEALKGYTSSAFFALAGVAVVCFLVSSAALFLLRDTINVPYLDRKEVLVSSAIFLGIFCASLPLETYPAILVGRQKLYLVNGVEVGARMAAMILMFILLSQYPSLLTICASSFVVRSVAYAGWAVAVRQIVPEASLSPRLSSRRCLRELVAYGSQTALINLSWLLITRKDATLITVFLGARRVPIYHFARLVVENITQACRAITEALRPTLIYQWAKGEQGRVYDIYYAGARYTTFVGAMLAAFFFAFGGDFLRLWIGERYVSGPAYFRSDLVLVILLAANLPRWMHNISWQLLFATNRQQALTWLIICESLTNIGLSIVLVRPYGVLGIALGTLIPMLVSHLLLLPWMMRRLVGISLRRFVRDGVGRPLLAAAAVFAACVVVRSAFPPAGWALFIVEGAGLGLLALLVGMVFVARAEERARGWQAVANWLARARRSPSAR